MSNATTQTHPLAVGEVGPGCKKVDPILVADDVTRTGWGVLLRGRAQVEYGDTVPIGTVDAWPEGSRLLGVRVDPRLVSGRRLAPGGSS